ncbi:MAG: hypothetical protein AAF532_14045 [Planctomycetota bacterium]
MAEHGTVPGRVSAVASRRRLFASFALYAAAATTLTGCNYLLFLGYMIGGPPSIAPDYDVQTGKSMTDQDVEVAIVCYAPIEKSWDFPDIDKDLAEAISLQLELREIKVKNTDRVQAWLDENPDWDRLEEVGAGLEVTHVIQVDLSEFSLYEPNSHQLYRGQATAIVSVWEMDGDGGGEKTYSKEIVSKYPLATPRSTSEESLSIFKLKYLKRLSDEIGRLFYEYYNGDDIVEAT